MEAVDPLEPLIESFGRAHALSPQQAYLVKLAATGLARKESSALIGCSLKTVEEHWRRIYHKTACNSERQVVARFLRLVLGAEGASL